MKQRWILAGGAGVVIVGGALLFMKANEPGAAPAKTGRSGKIDLVTGEPKPEQVASNDKQPPRMVMTESGLRPQTSREPRVWKDPKTGAINREIVDAVADPKEVARQEFEYRKSRLRLDLLDAAETCWNQGPSKEQIEIDYTLTVTDGVMRTENVRVKNSTITDAKVQGCIVSSFRDLSSFAENMPNMKQEGGLVVSLADLDKGNKKKDRREASSAPDEKTSIDKD
jgi:hypothetical protein